LSTGPANGGGGSSLTQSYTSNSTIATAYNYGPYAGPRDGTGTGDRPVRSRSEFCTGRSTGRPVVTGRTAGLPVDRSKPVDRSRPATDRLILFFVFFYMKIFKFLGDLHRFLHRMPKDQLVEAEYISCDYIEKKFGTGINYRPAGYRSTGRLPVDRSTTVRPVGCR
jgi:hypothetical protein